RGEEIVKENSDQSLGNVISTLFSIMWVYFRMQLFSILANQLVPVIPILVVIGLYFSGKFEVGELAVVACGFTAVSQGLTYFANQFGGLMTYFTVTKRIDDLYFTLMTYEGSHPAGQVIELTEGDVAAFDDVTILDESDRPVIAHLS